MQLRDRGLPASRGEKRNFAGALGLLRRGGAFAVVLACAAAFVNQAHAQSTARGRYFPLDQRAPPGMAGAWSTVQRDYLPCMQPMRVELPAGGGQVSFFCSAEGQTESFAAPAVAALRVGSTYRLKISGLRNYPGMEFYPTVELIDRLHPPRGREIEFAIPIVLTDEEFAFAAEGRMVTKVIYLEQPDRAIPARGPVASRNQLADPRENALALADEAGRPMAIIRLGCRTPDAGAIEPGFFGTGAPIQFFEQAAAGRETVRR